MSTVVFKQARIFIKGYDMSGDSNDLGLNLSSEMLDATTFGNNTRIHKGGLKVADVRAGGFWQSAATSCGSVDRTLFDNLGVDDVLMTLFGDGINEASTCQPGFAMQSVEATYVPGGSVGDLLPFTMTAMSRSELVHAYPLQDKSTTPLSTGAVTSTPTQVGAIESGLTFYAGLHGLVFATSTTGASLRGTYQNASSSGEPYNDIASITALTEPGGEFLTPIVGPNSTDRPWWRLQTCSCGAGVQLLGWIGIQ